MRKRATVYSCVGCSLHKVAQLREEMGAEIQPGHPFAKPYVLAQNYIFWGKRCLCLICKKAPFGIIMTLRENAAAAMRKLRRMQKKLSIWQKMARVLGAPGPLGVGTEYQSTELLPRPMTGHCSSLSPLRHHPNLS